LNPRHINAAFLPALLIVAGVGLAVAAALLGQSQITPPATARAVVVLDPAHGGPDTGAKLGDHLLEKDVTLALAARLRAELTAAGFSVVSTREADSFTPLTGDQRAEIANRAHATACVTIHATGTGSGVHLYVSELEPKELTEPADDATGEPPPPFEPTPWAMAQAESVGQSLRLQSTFGAALAAARIPVATGRAAVLPLDNMMCPALAVEVAPLVVAGEDTIPVTDPVYQQRLAESMAGALKSWRSHAQAPIVKPGAVAAPTVGGTK